jgi:pimeloyl-ACP methyl ester carboxylesterase
MNSPERLAHLHQSIRIASPMSVRWSGTLNDLEQMTLLPEAPDYSSIRAPIIAFYGELDTLVPLYHADYLVATVPGVELYVDPAGGHAPFLHNNWTFTQRRIVDFLQTHAPGFGG